MFSFSFCPNPQCTYHFKAPPCPWFSRAGSHSTKAFGPVPRFKCSSCRRTFSTQTFSIDYYAKRVVDYPDLLDRHRSAMSIRSLGRAIDASCGTVLNRIDRLARQALALHARLRLLASTHEDVCADGFVSFDVSQFFPNEIAISIAAESRFVLDLSHATRKRSGTMTKDQRTRAEELYPRLAFERGAITRGFRDILDSLEAERPPTAGRPLVLITDEKKEYIHALRSSALWKNQDEGRRIAHIRVNSQLPRTFQNPLFPSNYLDREIRKDQASQHRETTCFGRNVANGMTRLALYLVDHNYRKKYLIKAPTEDRRVHGEVAGIDRDLIDKGIASMFRERAFLSRIRLPGTLVRIWKKAFVTPFKTKADYLPGFAWG
jgi:transposase-like protein